MPASSPAPRNDNSAARRSSARRPNASRGSSSRTARPSRASEPPRARKASRGDSPKAGLSAHTTSSFGSCTNVGCVRPQNEDSLVVAPPLFVVADGMGGHAAGEVASEIAVQVLADKAPQHADAAGLGNAVVTANHAILRAAREGRGKEGMGTTCTAALLEGERLVIAQVGDSRAYLLHQGRLQQITRDHSLMADLIEAGEITAEEARVHPKRSVITRALGSDPRTEPDLYEINVAAGDRLLLCTDGLSGMIDNRTIAHLLASVSDAQQCAHQLVQAALAAGGHDNVTVVVADVEGFAEAKHHAIARKTKLTVAFVILALVLLLGGAAFAFNSWISSSAYLAEYEGKVAVYQGIPGELFGKEFSELAYTTTIEIDSLQPGAASRLRNEGIRTDDMKAALALVESYAMDLGTTFDEVATEATSEPPAPRNPEEPEEPEPAEKPQATEPPAPISGDAE